MEDQGYELLQAAAQRHGFDPLPAWQQVSADVQEQVLRVLRRLSLVRALDPRDGLGVLEREVGLGEDRALRIHLLLTCFEMLADATAEAGDAPVAGRALPEDVDFGEPFHRILTGLLGDGTLEWICGRCWVYRDEPLVAWDGLDDVESGFSRQDGEDLARLVESRKRWDEASADERLRQVAAVLRAIMAQYAVGEMPFARNTRSVWGNVGLLRKLAEAARADRLNLLSDTAFASFEERDLPTESFQGATVILDGDEAFVRRGDIPASELDDWATDLADWKPRADGGGEVLFAWHWGGALVVPEAPVARRLEAWLLEVLARLVAAATRPEAPSSASAATHDSDAAVA